jgi:hypothetical protein
MANPSSRFGLKSSNCNRPANVCKSNDRCRTARFCLMAAMIAATTMTPNVIMKMTFPSGLELETLAIMRFA